MSKISLIIIIILRIACCSTVAAQEVFFLSDLKIYNFYSGKNYSGRFSDVSGVFWDNSDLYKNENYAEISGAISFDYFENGAVHSIISGFDFGKNSKALHASPLVAFGYGRSFFIRENLVINWSVQNIIQIGGWINQTPCEDSFQRQFHCGTATPWIVAKESNKKRNSFPNVFSISVTRYF